MATSTAAALGASVAGVARADDVSESDTPGAPSVEGELKRFSTTAFGAEVTGPFVFEDGSLLYSLQHPNQDIRGSGVARRSATSVGSSSSSTGTTTTSRRAGFRTPRRNGGRSVRRLATTKSSFGAVNRATAARSAWA